MIKKGDIVEYRGGLYKEPWPVGVAIGDEYTSHFDVDSSNHVRVKWFHHEAQIHSEYAVADNLVVIGQSGV